MMMAKYSNSCNKLNGRCQHEKRKRRKKKRGLKGQTRQQLESKENSERLFDKGRLNNPPGKKEKERRPSDKGGGPA